MKKILILVALVAIAGVGYMLYSTYYSVSNLQVEEESLNDLDYLLDDAVNQEIDGALNEALLLNLLDTEDLAEEQAEIDLLSEIDSPIEVDQYLSEASQ